MSVTYSRLQTIEHTKVPAVQAHCIPLAASPRSCLKRGLRSTRGRLFCAGGVGSRVRANQSTGKGDAVVEDLEMFYMSHT